MAHHSYRSADSLTKMLAEYRAARTRRRVPFWWILGISGAVLFPAWLYARFSADMLLSVSVAGASVVLAAVFWVVLLRGLWFQRLHWNEQKCSPPPFSAVVEMLDSRELALCTMAQSVLIELLSTYAPANLGELSSYHKSILLGAVSDENSLLAVHVLDYFAETRDVQALPIVLQITKNPNAFDEKVVQSARSCLPVLQEQEKAIKIETTSLRPSSASTTPAQAGLLRPLDGNAAHFTTEVQEGAKSELLTSD